MWTSTLHRKLPCNILQDCKRSEEGVASERETQGGHGRGAPEDGMGPGVLSRCQHSTNGIGPDKRQERKSQR